ncbi:carbohydrate ABC transporter permease [Candidatus Epulonipiscium viviparus]|uniref:carbohydrate ABC transporter permease n=1 Tax=Candidatus Epulonipiscium viviparus TaxID=420336 RepID=UPI002738057D|nr:carbohydrate ABC transporter permease [Candidatus Epulopiscium viviparus]
MPNTPNVNNENDKAAEKAMKAKAKAEKAKAKAAQTKSDNAEDAKKDAAKAEKARKARAAQNDKAAAKADRANKKAVKAAKKAAKNKANPEVVEVSGGLTGLEKFKHTISKEYMNELKEKAKNVTLKDVANSGKKVAKAGATGAKDLWERNKKSDGQFFKSAIFNISYKIFRAILLFGLCFLILQPLMNKFALSIMSEADLYDPSVITVPRNPTLDNYKLVPEIVDFYGSLLNTVWVSALVAITQVASCVVVGYGFARFNFPLKKFWFGCVLLIIIVPPQTITSSLYLHFRFFDVLGLFEYFTGETINMHNSIMPYLLMCLGGIGLKSGLYVFLLNQFFRGIPKELEEAAYVDGCSTFRTFLTIMLPNAKAIVVACFLFAFVWQWTDIYYSRIFLGNVDLIAKTLPSISEALAVHFSALYGSGAKPSIAYTDAILSTGLLMTIVPLLIIYIVFQKSFVESLSQTGLKM